GRQPRRHGRPQGKRPRRSDRGSGTVWALTFMMVIWLMAVPAMMAAGGRAARHRAFAAADLAALAAAAHAAEGPRAACRQAVTIARASGGSVSACVLNGRIADVTVTVPLRGPAALGAVRARARARAGPVDPEP
ncbi:MAG: hypothetical protein JWO67_3121, partial [Streptosporangiaceae bacterium]|nr:hypothetical protein [Streptosporangiaceae bacterium]